MFEHDLIRKPVPTFRDHALVQRRFVAPPKSKLLPNGALLNEPLADICIATPGGRYADRVQELHIKVIHILIELIERKIFPENYRA